MVDHKTQAKSRKRGVKLLRKDKLDIVAKWNEKNAAMLEEGGLTLQSNPHTFVSDFFVLINSMGNYLSTTDCVPK